jgi:hypothetical protein
MAYALVIRNRLQALDITAEVKAAAQEAGLHTGSDTGISIRPVAISSKTPYSKHTKQHSLLPYIRQYLLTRIRRQTGME